MTGASSARRVPAALPPRQSVLTPVAPNSLLLACLAVVCRLHQLSVPGGYAGRQSFPGQGVRRSASATALRKVWCRRRRLLPGRTQITGCRTPTCGIEELMKRRELHLPRVRCSCNVCAVCDNEACKPLLMYQPTNRCPCLLSADTVHFIPQLGPLSVQCKAQ